MPKIDEEGLRQVSAAYEREVSAATTVTTPE